MENRKDLRANNGFPHNDEEGLSQLGCKPTCRFYELTGKVDARELLQVKYSDFDGFQEVLKAWDLIKEGKTN